MRRVARGASADDSFDDVFESEGGQLRADDSHLTTNSYGTNVNSAARKTANDNYREKLDPSPTGYRDYTPPAEVLQNRWDGSSLQRSNDHNRSNNPGYSIAKLDLQKKEETFTHKVRRVRPYCNNIFIIVVYLLAAKLSETTSLILHFPGHRVPVSR